MIHGGPTDAALPATPAAMRTRPAVPSAAVAESPVDGGDLLEEPVMTEVWAIRVYKDGHLCPPTLDDDSTESFLAWPSKEQAETGLKFQRDHGYLDDDMGEVVRVL